MVYFERPAAICTAGTTIVATGTQATSFDGHSKNVDFDTFPIGKDPFK